MFKKIILSLITIVLLSCSKGNENKLIIGVSPIPHQEIIELVRDDLKNEGIDLEVVVYNDYVQPNLSLKDKSLDANFFQHVPYMESFSKENGFELSSVFGVHLEPLKGYSENLKDIKDLSNDAEILIPNDPTNRGRALLLLDSYGLIKLNDRSKLDSSVQDIVENPKNLKITDLNSEQIAPRLKEVSLAIINTNNALAAGITNEKAVITEDSNSPYVNVIVVLKGNENNEKIQKLIKVLKTDKVKQFILDKYNGEVIPAFTIQE